MISSQIRRPSLWTWLSPLSAIMILFCSAASYGFEDTDGCLVCHKYPRMGRITEEGISRSYYVIPDRYAETVHRNVSCRDCHKDIKKIPHDTVTEGVTCDNECHSVKNPATGKNFSHKPIADVYFDSAHGRAKVANADDVDKPYCISCHTNPLNNPLELTPPHAVTDRCVICHEDRSFVNNWYKHTSRRIREVKRSSAEIIALCSTCHRDKALIDRRQTVAAKQNRELGRKFANAVVSYENSFHGKVTRYGFQEAANCLDCHADATNYYLSVHNILPSRNPDSPVNRSNRVENCQRCHTYADENYATIDAHPSSDILDNPFRYYAEKVYSVVGDTVLIALIALAFFETRRRRKDGVHWSLRSGSSWRDRRPTRGD